MIEAAGGRPAAPTEGEAPTAGNNSVRVKAKKRTVGKFGHAREPMRKSDIVCQAGVSPNVAIPAV